MKTNDRQFYEQFWAGCSDDLAMHLAVHRESRRPLHAWLKRLLPGQGGRFLEVGCGTALDSCLLAGERPDAEGWAADVSHEAMRLAQRYAGEMGVRLRLLVADLEALPFSAECFDLVFSQGVLEHFADPRAAVREQARVLKRGGVLLVDVPQKYNWYTVRKRRAMREGRWPWGWETEYSAGELKRWGAEAGLEPIGAIGHQHGRLLDRLVIHPHRTLRNKLAQRNGQRVARNYQPGAVARAWERAWDWIDSKVGAYTAINVAVAYRKL